MSGDTKISANHIANWFINKAIDDENNPLSIMQVLKLTYIAEGFHQSLYETTLFKEEIEAWKHGPVVRSTFIYIKDDLMKNSNYSHFINKKADTFRFSNEIEDILSVVFKKYRKFTGWDLSNLTHEEGTPWYKTFYDEEKGEGSVISKDLIRDYFSEKIISEGSFAILLSET